MSDRPASTAASTTGGQPPTGSSAAQAPPSTAATAARAAPNHTLTLQPLGHSVPVAPGQSLLEAARAAGLQLRSSCRNGTCRECMARLLAGQVHYRIEWPGLSVDEKAEGWVLPCVALPGSDVVLQAR